MLFIVSFSGSFPHLKLCYLDLCRVYSVKSIKKLQFLKIIPCVAKRKQNQDLQQKLKPNLSGLFNTRYSNHT